MSPGIIPGQFGSRIYYEQLRCWPQMNRPGGRAYRPPCPRLDLDPLGQDREPGLKTRSTMVHRRRFSGTWRSSDAGTPGSRILSPTAGRKPPKSERSKVCCASSIFPLANRQYRWIVTSFIWLLPLQNPCIAEEEHGPVSHFPVANELTLATGFCTRQALVAECSSALLHKRSFAQQQVTSEPAKWLIGIITSCARERALEVIPSP